MALDWKPMDGIDLQNRRLRGWTCTIRVCNVEFRCEVFVRNTWFLHTKPQNRTWCTIWARKIGTVGLLDSPVNRGGCREGKRMVERWLREFATGIQQQVGV